VIGEPNTLCWVELVGQNVAAARDFYRHVLGWDDPVEFQGLTDAPSYLWRLAGRPIASMVRTDLPEHAAAYWRPCFAVTDCEASVARARQLGGTVTAPCVDSPHGRSAGLRDPTSAPLVIIECSPGAHSVVGWR
jgi:predicted enzyme related to lactoylglutathione lyase